MIAAAPANFAARLAGRLGTRSELLDAASGERFTGLAATIEDFAASFAAAGLQRGDRVLIGCNLRPLSALAYLGAMFGGFTAVPVNENALASAGAAVAHKTGARALWIERSAEADRISPGGLVRLVGRPPRAGAGARDAAACAEHDLAALMATSGSTGEPRFVKVTHGNLIANTEAIIRSQRLAPDERAMLILPVSYCFGASVLHTHLYEGGSVVFDARFMFPDKVLRAMGEHRCTSFAGVPTAYQILLRRSNLRSIPLPTLRRFLQAGGALSPASIRQIREIVPRAGFFVMYGQTEATARIASLPPERLEEKLGSVGVPLDNLTVRIVDAAGGEVAAGESGELWVSGGSISPGYLDAPEETRRKFRAGWLATGDIAARDADGYLWITGRKGEFVKVRGVRVGLAQIEATIAAVPGVLDCAAAGVPHAEAGEALALYVVAAEARADIAAAIRRRLPSEWTCDSITLVPELPRNAHGKLMRARLAQLSASTAGADASAGAAQRRALADEDSRP
ncbi:MAG TPA: AMP-binding protein [Steroidobacteraceae bacterium]|nr:AMP-binding protein [Steroidobacteraceae bacterium]